MSDKKHTRRDFVKKSAAVTAGLYWAASARSYGNILGANDRINCAAVGVHGRGKALIRSLATAKNSALTAVCDVDKREFDLAGKLVQETFGSSAANAVTNYVDFRKLLENKDVDAILIATPEHWHAPMSLMGVQAGKHVYVEKPCSHNPREGELLVEAQQKYKRVIQMGNQQRSAPTSIQAVADIGAGLIGDVYYGKAWYANNRKSIGVGKSVAVPDWLDWDLWQGPAPREGYKDNYVHYNWHWFWNWGTGEINNNGTHEIDICRWALGVEFPKSVISSGGRFHFKDDWQFYDTQNVNYEFEGGKMITWEGRSCNGFKQHERGRGVTLHGTKGTILLDRNGYKVYDNEGKLIKDVKEKGESATLNTVGGGFLTDLHMQNFVNAVRQGERQNSPIRDGHITNLLCHLGNISQKVGRKLMLDTDNGRILRDRGARKYWSRDYAPGWEMKV
ncbi:Gfo/Idh/MocA family oxidoreductase [Exilibacterium tricleocarpae]|uniref:Gfo/Idh/MocA family oxidoreductase n=1 Tax=Exilibacterium tricleocarpae TaxID=2591008 RepID=A0A545T5U8_9GAMM|nr:Gfo/Idh/MocA family oxidoreductase [Exilibacterium tricleocarpae]TQV72594.1 Gfo/Idh/MocA family oxidoreductase [Exilibacterium tricleocarpae]